MEKCEKRVTLKGVSLLKSSLEGALVAHIAQGLASSEWVMNLWRSGLSSNFRLGGQVIRHQIVNYSQGSSQLQLALARSE